MRFAAPMEDITGTLVRKSWTIMVVKNSVLRWDASSVSTFVTVHQIISGDSRKAEEGGE